MLFTIEILPAKEGDCLLVHWGTANDNKLAVIDGGPSNVYENTLRKRLAEISDNLEVKPLPIELVLVSHVDNDHIVGVRKLVREIAAEQENHMPEDMRAFKMKRLWHNTFNDVLGDSINQHYKKLPLAMLQATADGSPDPQAEEKLTKAFKERHGEHDSEAREHAHEIALILASHGEGRKVRDDHKLLLDHQQTATLNSPFKDANGFPTLITAEMTPNPKSIAGLKFKIVGPMQDEIDALQEEFDEYIKDKGLTEEAVLAAYADKSVTNLSSIVCLVEHGGKTLFLTGDARGDHILEGLEEAGLLDDQGRLSVDVLKVPHHGSEHNVEPEFFEKVIADTYIFSADGKNANPDRSTLEWLVAARGQAPMRIILTYEVGDIDQKRKHHYQVKGKPWNQATDALKPFLDGLAHSHPNIQLDAGNAGASVLVELGDEAIEW